MLDLSKEVERRKVRNPRERERGVPRSSPNLQKEENQGGIRSHSIRLKKPCRTRRKKKNREGRFSRVVKGKKIIKEKKREDEENEE